MQYDPMVVAALMSARIAEAEDRRLIRVTRTTGRSVSAWTAGKKSRHGEPGPRWIREERRTQA